jgi:F0F1-type ATP synthase membrane subunit b/b'
MPELIDERDDPLELQGFFPCARPLYATMTSDTLVPVPDFVLYQDQAVELDILSDRIDGLVKALRVRGVYDASQPALQRLMTEGENNALIPVDKWMAFGEKGGLKGSIDLLPLDTLADALLQCYRARTEIKNQIYEITGLSDIIRGSTMASETATAQQIKGQYASLRLRAMQEDVAMFATELLRLKTEVICSKFQPQTILMYAAAQQMQPADQQMIPQALELLKDNPLRSFRIEVAADSLVQMDEQQTKRDRIEFIQAFGGFLKEALPVAQASPAITPMLVEVMKFGIGAFKQSKPIEGALDAALDQMKQQQAQPQQPRPDPEMMKLQAQQQADQMRAQADVQAAQAKAQIDAQIQQAKMQSEMQIEQMKQQASAQSEAQRQQHEASMKAQEFQAQEQFDRWKAELDAATKIMVAQIGAKASMDQAMQSAEQAAASELQAAGMQE